MPLNWNAEGDFAQVVDTLESLVWKRRCNGEEQTIEAWRFSETTRSTEDAIEGVIHHDALWQAPFQAEESPPEQGDLFIDSDGACWTLWRVDRLRGSTRYRCASRRVELRRDLAEWLDLEEAIVDVGGPDPVITGWRVARPALRGVIGLIQSDQDPLSAALTIETYRVVLSEPVSATPNHRFRTHAGRVLRVKSGVSQPNDGYAWSFEATPDST